MSERHPIFATFYDFLMVPQDWLGARKRRQRVVGGARGRVLEIGVGTGLNLALYAREATEVVGIEPDPFMIRRARGRAAAGDLPIRLVEASGETLPFPDGCFDSVVATLVFCTIPDAAVAAREARRVLKPGGTLHFFEHVRARRPGLAGFQDRIAPLWRRVFAGCHPNRDTIATLEGEGFAIERFEASGPGILVEGVARPS